MNRERAKELLPIIQAYAEGKEIQTRKHEGYDWCRADCPDFYDNIQYRIKPEPPAPKYRPFNADELPLLVGYTLRNKSSGHIELVRAYSPSRHTVLLSGSACYSATELLTWWVIQEVDRQKPQVGGLNAVTERPCGVLEDA